MEKQIADAKKCSAVFAVMRDLDLVKYDEYTYYFHLSDPENFVPAWVEWCAYKVSMRQYVDRSLTLFKGGHA